MSKSAAQLMYGPKLVLTYFRRGCVGKLSGLHCTEAHLCTEVAIPATKADTAGH